MCAALVSSHDVKKEVNNAPFSFPSSKNEYYMIGVFVSLRGVKNEVYYV